MSERPSAGPLTAEQHVSVAHLQRRYCDTVVDHFLTGSHISRSSHTTHASLLPHTCFLKMKRNSATAFLSRCQDKFHVFIRKAHVSCRSFSPWMSTIMPEMYLLLYKREFLRIHYRTSVGPISKIWCVHMRHVGAKETMQ